MPDQDDHRVALLDQLAYLIDEVEALKAVIDRVPPVYQEARPLPGDLSLKELYGLLAALDEEVHLPRVQRMTEETEPTFALVDKNALVEAEDWNDRPLEHILERVQEARQRLLDHLSTLPPEAWTRTARWADATCDVFTIAHHITQHDTDLLRTIGHRLHEAQLG